MATEADDIDALRAELAALREQLTESQRLATVGTIAAVIAHEFNNLLTPIVSYCQMALTAVDGEKADPAFVKKALAKSLTHATKAGRISASMLNLCRGEGEDDTVRVRALVDEALAVLARDPQRDGINLRVHVRPELAVRGDPVQLEQVLLNLLINARQAMLDGHEACRGASLTIKADADGEQVKITVTDSGPGIAERHLARIFEPFFTTKTAGKPGEPRGSGLGLHICKQIVERHHGRIEVSSTPGKGATFSVLLPAA